MALKADARNTLVQDELLYPGAPLALQVEITSHCNLQCRMCPLTTGFSSSAMSVGHMSEMVWSELMPLARRASQVFVAGFGEPLTNPRCLDLLQQLNDEGIRTTLSTNGLALNPVTAGRLAALPFLVHINVSIDSPNRTTYRQIRGGNLHRALAGLSNLVEAMPDASRITVSSVAMRENIEELADFPPLLDKLGVRTYIVQGLNDYTSFCESQGLSGVGNLHQHLADVRSACNEWNIELVLTTFERTTAEEDRSESVLSHYFDGASVGASETRQCLIPWEQPYIDKDGRVFPCCIAGASSESQLGQLGQSSLSEIWAGEPYREFRSALLDPATTPAVCQRCTVVPSGPHPLRAYQATLEGSTRMCKSDGAVTVAFRNTGSHTWARDSVRVATAMPRDRASEAEHPTWISQSRACGFAEETVEPGEIATFAFQIYIPARRRTEEFQLVANDTTWIPNTRFTVVTPSAMRRPLRTSRWLIGRMRRRVQTLRPVREHP